MTLTLESADVTEKSVIQQYFQIVDNAKTEDPNPKDCESGSENEICTYYESLTCAFEYDDSLLNGGVNIKNTIIQGFKGVKKLDTVGAFTDFYNSFDEKTSTYPWFVDYERSNLYKNSDAETKETKLFTTCSVFRPFVTDWSEINLKSGDELTAITGYGIYELYSSETPSAKGSSEEFVMIVLEGAQGLLTGLIGLTTISIFFVNCVF